MTKLSSQCVVPKRNFDVGTRLLTGYATSDGADEGIPLSSAIPMMTVDMM